MNSGGLRHTYCSFISYIGTKFCGSQRQIPRRNLEELSTSNVRNTIQQVLDESLAYIVPKPLFTAGKKTLINEEDNQTNDDNQINSDINKNLNNRTDDQPIKRYLFDDEDLFGYRTFVTSRTDSGVCANMNCYLFDLIHPNANSIYRPDHLTISMNKYLIEKKFDLIVNKTIMFNRPSMNYEIVKEKQYCYRLAILKPEILTKNMINELTFLDNNNPQSNDKFKLKENYKPIELLDYKSTINAYTIYSFLPINELNRVLVLNSKYLTNENGRLKENIIDINKMINATKLFLGTYNFTSFSTYNNRTNSFKQRSPIKTISRFEFKERNRIDEFDSRYNNFLWFDVYVKADGFLYNQIRRMMGCLIAYGFNLINVDDIEFMLNNPDCKNFNSNCVITPASGLYLNKIEFKEEIEDSLWSDEELIDLKENKL